MKIESLHVGMRVKHPQYGTGIVKTIGERTAEIRFDEGQKTVEPDTAGLEPAEAQLAITGLEKPLGLFLLEIIRTVFEEMGYQRPDAVSHELGPRWHKGRMVLHPPDPTLQTKEVPIEVFFHKIVMMRNNLRVLEQKINSHPQLSEAEKIEMQQYVTRCYGSMTTFNLLFKNKADQFNT